jgi:hypothetical protein
MTEKTMEKDAITPPTAVPSLSSSFIFTAVAVVSNNNEEYSTIMHL